jgi:bifunctional DNA-binding transcriptional regulator/antitoxin component of YhaV-PrlF toxin-antitoxin module
MITTQYLKLIGKGQITIPLKWRELLGIKSGAVKANIDKGKIVIEPVEEDNVDDWIVEQVSLNELSKEDQKIIRAARKRYKKGDTSNLISMEDFFNGNF